MSHIEQARVVAAYKNRELLIKALSTLGKVVENTHLYTDQISHFSRTSDRYSLVLVDNKDDHFRIGFREVDGVWQQYNEPMGQIGEWAKRMTPHITDRYITFHYHQELVEAGYDAQIKTLADGSYEVYAEERAA